MIKWSDKRINKRLNKKVLNNKKFNDQDWKDLENVRNINFENKFIKIIKKIYIFFKVRKMLWEDRKIPIEKGPDISKLRNVF